MHKEGDCILGWKCYAQGKPRLILAVRNTGYDWVYLGESTIAHSEESTKLDPMFSMPCWAVVPTDKESVVEAQSKVIDRQSEEILRLLEKIERLEIQLRQRGG